MQQILTSHTFRKALEQQDLTTIRKIPKTDFHNHGSLGLHLSTLRTRTGINIPDPPQVMHSFQEFMLYLRTHLQAVIYTGESFLPAIDDTIAAAIDDGVTELEISIDCQIIPAFNSYQELIDGLDIILRKYPEIIVRPEIGINREWNATQMEQWVIPLIESGFFAGLDLYGNEMFGEPEDFVAYYALGQKMGMRLKAHAGEYRDAEFVRRSVEVLELTEVQHGIGAASSPEVMRWLADHQIRLNICPTSNLRLARVAEMSAHPVRHLVDAGIPVTINSDDLVVFGQTVSEEFLNLYNAGVLTTQELDDIRVRAFRK